MKRTLSGLTALILTVLLCVSFLPTANAGEGIELPIVCIEHTPKAAVRENETAATCTEAGQYDAVVYCAVCEAEISRETVRIDALGHDYVDGICSRCGDEEPIATDPCDGYTDINRNAWYHDAVDYVIANGYMGSTKTDALTFEPNTKVSRAMVAALLYRIAAGEEAVSYQAIFTDVPAGKWFTESVEWCAQNGLCNGKGNGIFDPNGNVTRQELAAFMYNLADYLGEDVSGRADLSTFKDGASVPGWARDYIAWAVDAKLISGKGVDGAILLAPIDSAGRAELASIIMSFMTKTLAK